ncbi:Ig-like domain-containing protein [Companilactobacillus musae]|uniref:Ig-like domain-containing protein n=1 Tax=Companilactobacillus musae TaxID=1903258 RepID=UPI000E65BCB7|nr:Ig-like domain-containing protein [Companilactobacillus musae]
MNNYLISKKTAIFILPIFIFSILCIAGNQTEIILADAGTETNPGNIYFKKPSLHPVRFGVWVTGGFNVNLNSDYYVKVGDPLKLETHSVRSQVSTFEHPFEPLEHSWFEKKPNKNWSLIKGATNPSLNIDTSKVGTSYYQIHDLYSGIFSDDSFFSNSAAVHVIPNDIPAKSIKINVDNDYIYNSDNNFDKMTAYAHAELTPSDATEKVIWSISNTNLATIDQDGKITSVSGKEGSFFIKATITNKDGSVFSDTKLMNVGGGLYDQKARAGENATFTIQGFDDAIRDNTDHLTVEWHKKDPQGHDTKLMTPVDPFIYITGPVSEKDNGDEYYAIIKLRDKTLKTSVGKLSVLPTLDPNVVLNGKLQNISFNDGQDSSTALFNVVNGDTINYVMNLNNNGQRDLFNNKLSFYLSLKTEVMKIIIDGKQLDEHEYKINSNIDNNNQLIEIPVGNLKIGKQKNVQIETLTHGINNQLDFHSTPSFTGTDSDGHLYQSIGNPLELHYVSNKITPHFKDIQFESIYSFEKDVLKFRTNDTNSPNEIVHIDDQRRKKNPIRIFLKQPGSLSNSKNGSLLVATLQFYKLDKLLPQNINNKILIEYSQKNQTLKSIHWNKDEGLLLHVDDTNFIAGQYNANLSWIIEDAP